MKGFLTIGRAAMLRDVIAVGERLMPAAFQPKTFRDYFHKAAWLSYVGPHKGRRVRIYKTNGKRECRRRFLSDAALQQRNSHKPGTVQPRHIFGDAR